MKTRVTKGWTRFGTNEQDAYSMEARRKYDLYCMKLDRKTTKVSAEARLKECDKLYELKQLKKASYAEAKEKGLLKSKKEKAELKEARKAERKAKRLAKKN